MVRIVSQIPPRETKNTSRLLPGLAVKEGMIRHPFDLEFGVRTSGLVAGRHLNAGHPNDRHATAYYAVAPSIFQSLLVRWRRCGPAHDLDEYSFIDLGAGMGRAVLLAAQYRYHAAIGVEFHPTLARIARRNVALWRIAGRARTTMKIHCRDAEQFNLPDGPCLIFLFNPFGAPVLRRLLKAWSQTLIGREQQVDILYVNNEQEQVFASRKDFKRFFSGQVRRSQQDTLADRNILTSQPGAEYSASAWEDCSIYRWVGESGDKFRRSVKSR
jgi:SAM-dependent methyltransferase